MKSYPSIDTKFVFDRQITVFDKLDGSNIRAEWSLKKGFYKFGSRNRLLDESDPFLGPAKTQMMDTVAPRLSTSFKNQKFQRAIAFFEYWGKSSFAGSHERSEEHFLTLIDVAPYKQGMMAPSDFLNAYAGYDGWDTPKVLFLGTLSADLIDRVKQGTLEDMTFEGVVCKYVHKKQVGMFKIKSRAWLAKLREKCGDNDALFRRLA